MQDIRVLFIQARDDAESIADEQRVMLPLLRGVELEIVNLFSGSLPQGLSEYHGVILGGGPLNPAQDFAHKAELRALVQHVCDRGMPFLGICFGFEMLVDVVGVTLVREERYREFGTKTMYLTAAGKRDPFFRNVPEKFLAHENHHWCAPHVPKGSTLLAHGNAVHCQAIRIGEAPIYGVQFHPELDVVGMRHRVAEYQEGFLHGMKRPKRLYQRISETPFGPSIVHNFLDIIKTYANSSSFVSGERNRRGVRMGASS